MITHQDLQRVTPRILERLRSMALLPNDCIVAGQAVATLLYEELGCPMSGPINDIDVFVSKNLPADQRQVVYSNTPSSYKPRPHNTFSPWKGMALYQRKIVSTSKKITEDIELGEEDYKLINIIGQRGSISVLRTYRRDMLNYTLISGAEMGPAGYIPNETVQGLVNGFDINCVAVGINVRSQALVCTPEFLEFMNTAVLRPQSYHTPGYTLIRLAKKAKGLSGVLCDFEKEKDVLLCASALQRENMWRYQKDGGHLHTFGSKYHAMLEDLPNLPPIKLVKAEPPLWTFDAPKNAVVKRLTEHFKSVHYTNTDFARSVLFTRYLHKLWDASESVRDDIFTQLKKEDVDHLSVLHTLDSSVVVPPTHPDVEEYNKLPQALQKIHDNLKGTVNEIHEFVHNKEQFYANKLLQLGVHVFEKVASDSNEFKTAYPILMRAAHTPEGTLAVRRSLERSYVANVIPAGAPSDCMERLVRIALPDLRIEPTASTRMTSNIVEVCMDPLWTHLLPESFPPLHAQRALHRFLHMSASKKEEYTPQLERIFTRLLDDCCDEGLASLDFMQAIGSGGSAILMQRLERVPELYFQKIKEENSYQENWNGRVLDSKTTVFFEKLALLRALKDVPTTTKAPRKM